MLIWGILPSLVAFAQLPESMPASLHPNTAVPSISEVYAKFDTLMASTDSTLNHEKIKAQR